MEFKYNKIGDYYIPDIQAPANNTSYKIGRFGRLRENYLKENKPSIYNHLLMTSKLQQDIIQADKDAKEQLEILINQLKEKENLDENLKNSDPLTWVGKMNSIKKQAEILKKILNLQASARYIFFSSFQQAMKKVLLRNFFFRRSKQRICATPKYTK